MSENRTRLLLISDDETLKHQIQNSGYEVATQMDDAPFSLALFDLDSTTMDIDQTLMRLKSDHDVPILVIATARDSLLLEKYLSSDGVDYLIKPFSIGMLKRRIEVWQDGVRLRSEINDLMSVAAHDLKSAVASIQGYADVLLTGMSGELDEQQMEFLKIIRLNAGRVRSLIDTLRDVARIDTGRLQFDFDLIYGTGLAQEALQPLKEALTLKDQTLTVNIPADLPVVWGDENHLVQVIRILVDNARKFTLPGGQITVSARDCSDDGDHQVRFAVQDNGLGIASEEADKLFDKWFRSAGTDEERPGSGAGLYIARHIVERHGGRIWFESEPGVGTTFYFTVPTARLDELE